MSMSDFNQPNNVVVPVTTAPFVEVVSRVNFGSSFATKVDANGTVLVGRAVLFSDGMVSGGKASDKVAAGQPFGFLGRPQKFDPCATQDVSKWAPKASDVKKEGSNYIYDFVVVTTKGVFKVFLKDGEKAKEGDQLAMKLGDLSTGGGELVLVEKGKTAPTGSVLLNVQVVTPKTYYDYEQASGVVTVRLVDNVTLAPAQG